MAYVEERPTRSWRLIRAPKFKNTDNAGRHPGYEASPAVSQALGIRISAIQSNPTAAIVIGYGDPVLGRRNMLPYSRRDGNRLRIALAECLLRHAVPADKQNRECKRQALMAEQIKQFSLSWD